MAKLEYKEIIENLNNKIFINRIIIFCLLAFIIVCFIILDDIKKDVNKINDIGFEVKYENYTTFCDKEDNSTLFGCLINSNKVINEVCDGSKCIITQERKWVEIS